MHIDLNCPSTDGIYVSLKKICNDDAFCIIQAGKGKTKFLQLMLRRHEMQGLIADLLALDSSWPEPPPEWPTAEDERGLG